MESTHYYSLLLSFIVSHERTRNFQASWEMSTVNLSSLLHKGSEGAAKHHIS